MANTYKTTLLRGPSAVSQDGAKRRIVSPDGTRYAISANRKRSLPNHRFDVVEVWTLKQRVNGKSVTVASNRSESDAQIFVYPVAPSVPDTPVYDVREVAQWFACVGFQIVIDELKALPDAERRQCFEFGGLVNWNRLPASAKDAIAKRRAVIVKAGERMQAEIDAKQV